MAIEAVFQHLVDRFEAARDAFQSLSLTVIEDRPPRDEVLLVERLGNLIEDLRGWLVEGLAAAADARQAVGHPLDSYGARHALGVANERFVRLEHRFYEEAAAYDTLDALIRFGRQRGGEWLGWSGSVVTAMQGCGGPLRELDETVLRAWQELSERLDSSSLQVQTTSIGQQFATPLRDRRRAAREASDAIEQ
jgi:hypothetical protein